MDKNITQCPYCKRKDFIVDVEIDVCGILFFWCIHCKDGFRYAFREAKVKPKEEE